MSMGSNLTKQNKKLNQPQDSKSILDNANETVLQDKENQNKNEVMHQYCVFKSGEEEYAIPINLIKEVVKFSEFAPIPQMPIHILGISNVRGNIFGVMNLDFYFKGVMVNETFKYLIVLDHEEYNMAIAIQEVPNSLSVSHAQLEQLSTKSFKSVIGQNFLQGVIKIDNRMIILINVLDMIADEKFTQIVDY